MGRGETGLAYPLRAYTPEGVWPVLLVALVSSLAGLGGLLGGWMTTTFAVTRERLSQMSAAGTGVLLGAALLTMLPSALDAAPRGAQYVAAGYLALLLFRRIGGHQHGDSREAEAARAAFSGLLLHSLLDGAALGVAARTDPRLGLVAFAAVFLHKVPEGFSMAAVVLAAGGARRLALLAAGAVGAATVVGALLTAGGTGGSLSHGALLGIAAGSLLYVATSDMVPTVEEGGWNTLLILAGMLFVYLISGGGHAH